MTTVIECVDCGAAFDTDRDGGATHADTRRCPSCGEAHTDAEVAAAAIEPATDGGTTASSAVEIQLTVRVSGVDDASDLDVSVDD